MLSSCWSLPYAISFGKHLPWRTFFSFSSFGKKEKVLPAYSIVFFFLIEILNLASFSLRLRQAIKVSTLHFTPTTYRFKKDETSNYANGGCWRYGTSNKGFRLHHFRWFGTPFPYRGVSLIVVCSLIPNFRFITCSQFSKARLPPDDQECRALPQLSSHLLLFIFTTHFIKRKRRKGSVPNL